MDILRLPSPHPIQEIFFYWSEWHPDAQCLVAPAGTKLGKSFGCALWMIKEAVSHPNLYCAWIAPTYLKCRIGYRYIRSMLPDCDRIRAVDGRLEISFENGSFIKFLHGRDAEVTVEGEAIDRFVIDESGKITQQVWYSLLTTITQTRGLGIVTGTPRGFNWYYKLYRRAQTGDKFFVHCRLSTEDSPFVSKEAIANARRILPQGLFDQYYKAMFTSEGSVFGDITKIFDESLVVPEGKIQFWLHPNAETRNMTIVHGVDLAKQKDYTVFYSVNEKGQLVGYCRFIKVPYPQQALRLETYIKRFFSGSEVENLIRYDATGVGVAVGDMFAELDVDAAFTAVTFTNKTKMAMITRTVLAIQHGWHTAPRIEEIEHEFGSYEVNITAAGNATYAAPEGEHDDIVSAAILAISAAYQNSMADEAEKMVQQLVEGSNIEDLDSYTSTHDDDDFFEQETHEEFHFDFEDA